MQIDIKFSDQGEILPFVGDKPITMSESPFLIFLATAGMCSAVYVRTFLVQRNMSLEGVSIIQNTSYNKEENRVDNINIHIELPESFPVKYKNAIKSAVSQCPVKRHLGNPPSFKIQTSFDLEINA